jgi:hypothetical protein
VGADLDVAVAIDRPIGLDHGRRRQRPAAGQCESGRRRTRGTGAAARQMPLCGNRAAPVC